MFSRNFLLVSSALLFAIALGAREWLIHQEIDSIQESLRSQITQQLESAQNSERLQEYSKSQIAFERFLEPVISEVDRLAWPFSRLKIMQDWRRDVHILLSDLSAQKRLGLEDQFKREISLLLESQTPSLSRMMAVLEKQESVLGDSGNCRATVKEETQAMKLAAQKRDEDVLNQIRVEGVAKLSLLKRNVQRMSKKEMGEFLGAGKFTREIEQPVIDLVMKLGDSNLRASTWNQFQKKLEAVLSKKNLQLAKSERLHSERLQKLFDPLTEAIAESDRLAKDSSAPMVEEPSSLVDPTSYDNPNLDPVPGNPSSADEPSTLLE